MCAYVISHGQVKCVQLLLDKGSKVKADNDGLSVLEICAQVSIAHVQSLGSHQWHVL